MLLAIPKAVFISVLKKAFTNNAAPWLLPTVVNAPIETQAEKLNISLYRFFSLHNLNRTISLKFDLQYSQYMITGAIVNAAKDIVYINSF